MTDRNDTRRSRDIWDPETQGADRTALQSSLTEGKTSALEKYQEIFVGSSGLAKIVRYELLTAFLGPLPGGAGMLLRKIFYPRILGRVGRNVVFGRSMTIRHPHKIRIGDNVVFDDYAVLDAKGTDNTGILIGDNVLIGRSTVISCKNGDIVIGKNSNIAMNCFIQSAAEVKIGNNVLFSAYCYLIGGGDHRTDRTDIPIMAQGQAVKGIRVEDNCLLGAGVLVQDGVTIGRDAVIGTGAVVREDVPPFGIAAGVPARVVKMRK